jgi:hypothetical protein
MFQYGDTWRDGTFDVHSMLLPQSLPSLNWRLAAGGRFLTKKPDKN